MILWSNSVIDAVAVFIVLLLYTNVKHNKSGNFSDAIFEKMLVFELLYLAADFAGWIIDGEMFPFSYGIQLTVNSLIYIAQCFCTFCWLLYTDYWINNSTERIKKRLPAYLLPVFVEIVLLAVNIFNGCLFTIDKNGFYVRGKFFSYTVLVFFVYGTSAFIKTMHELFTTSDKKRKGYCLWLSAFMLPTISATFLQMYAYGSSLIAPSYALSLLMVYLNVHQRKFEEEKLKVAKRDAQLQEARVNIMLSQIQPHFLYNSLTAISDLCGSDPVKAKKILKNFADYLRVNMDSLKRKECVTFEKELKHVKTYLEIEKERFGDKLIIEFDIKEMNFMLPSLTVQPIVENAVRCGIQTIEKGAGTVKVSTYSDNDNYYVKISDDGIGFDAEKTADTDRTHIGIENVRSRLSAMCGGKLCIDSKTGEGTTAFIIVPKEWKNKSEVTM